MYFMNEIEVDEAVERYAFHPALSKATAFLKEFMDEVNSHSDGWAYWRPPVQAAKQLMMLIASARTNPQAVTERQFEKTLSPIRAFYTRRGYAAGMKFPKIG